MEAMLVVLLVLLVWIYFASEITTPKHHKKSFRFFWEG
jgi:hypothetical protein